MSDTVSSRRFADLTFRDWVKKIILFVAVAVFFGWIYGWVSPRMFPKETKFGFVPGILHGAMLPLALPTLVMGKDVELFGANNTGRTYKIGYICGLNLCGLFFFGSAFWKPGKKPPSETGS